MPLPHHISLAPNLLGIFKNNFSLKRCPQTGPIESQTKKKKKLDQILKLKIEKRRGIKIQKLKK